MTLKLAVLVSGRGSNLEAILNAISTNSLNATVQIVISNKPDAGALDIAKKHGVAAKVIDNEGLKRVPHEEKLIAELQLHDIDFIVLAGYMRVLTPFFLRHFKTDDSLYRIINIHPSFLPAFPGKDAYGDAFAAGVKESGITVHLVDEEVDHGPILAQQKFPRLADDTLETFKQRGLAIEHNIFPNTLQQIAVHGLDSLIKGRVTK